MVERNAGFRAGTRCRIDRTADGGYRWRLKAQNGREVAVAAHGYSGLRDCQAALEDLRRRAAELSGVLLHSPEDGNGWFWTARDAEGRTLAVSPRAYERYSTCQAAYERFAALLKEYGDGSGPADGPEGEGPGDEGGSGASGAPPRPR